MPSLTHVCMWSDKGWTRITAEEAAKLHPGGTVSAYSGLFMCELCGQYVSLTNGNVKTRYFKHSASEKSKNCPERTFGVDDERLENFQEHDLPIRINVSASSFGFEVGLLRVPIDLLSKDFHIEIKAKGTQDISYVFTKERFKYDSITYFPIGERPFEAYTLRVQNGNDKLREFWPTEIKGIDPKGTLFEKFENKPGKKLTNDADVEIRKEYYLLKRGYLYEKSYGSIHIEEIVQKKFEWETWRLYVVYASEFNEEAARFYHDFHCRLTVQPVTLQPIWPLFIEGDYIVKHNQISIYMLVRGNVSKVTTFPAGKIHRFNDKASQPKLYEIFCSGRQQLISTGRTQTLQYTYFWKEPLDRSGLHPEFSVTDFKENEVASGESNILPLNNTLLFKSVFDGEIIISNNNRITDRRKISADGCIEINGLSYGISVQLVIGLDVVWKIRFVKQKDDAYDDEFKIMRQIISVSGKNIPAPHSLRNIMVGMRGYPMICRWIKKCIQSGIINEQSYRRLQDIYRNINTNNRGDI